MTRYISKRKEDIGLSPQAIVFRGKKKTDNIHLHFYKYNKDTIQERTIDSLNDITVESDLSDYYWLDIVGLHETDKITEVGSKFIIPQNILSDILDPNIRPKIEEFDDGIFLSLKILHYSRQTEKLYSDNLSLVIKENILITFQEREDDVFNPVRERLKKPNNKIMRVSGSDYLAFTLIDIIIDNYIYIMGMMGDKIEKMEESVYGKPIQKNILNSIHFYKRELNYFRRQVKPAREMIMSLVKLDSDCIRDENDKHFRELRDNVKEASDLSDSYREILYDLLNMYHTIVSTKLNDIMKVLTIFSVIFIPLTFIVGVYGTNFQYFPELQWKYGYFIMWGVIILVAVGMLIYFKRKKWF